MSAQVDGLVRVSGGDPRKHDQTKHGHGDSVTTGAGAMNA